MLNSLLIIDHSLNGTSCRRSLLFIKLCLSKGSQNYIRCCKTPHCYLRALGEPELRYIHHFLELRYFHSTEIPTNLQLFNPLSQHSPKNKLSNNLNKMSRTLPLVHKVSSPKVTLWKQQPLVPKSHSCSNIV